MPVTWIPFSLSKSEYLIIKIYSSTGQLVRTLNLNRKDSGAYLSKEKAAYWDGRNEAGQRVSSGVYFYRVVAGANTVTQKLMLAR